VTGGATWPRISGLWRALDARRLLVVALAGAAFAMALRPIGDPDLWTHLRIGELILAARRLPATDPFSYLSGGAGPWILYSWLPEVAMATLARTVGFHALRLVAAALLAATALVVLAACRRAGARPTVAVAATAAATLVASGWWSVRPHVLSVLFLALTLHVAAGAGDRRARRAWLLVPLFALWSNCHILFFYGLAVLWLTVAVRGALGGRPAGALAALDRPARALVAAAVAATLACCLNPYGPAVVLRALTLARESAAFEIVSELRPPDFHDLRDQLAGALLLVTAAVLALSPRRKDPLELLWVFGFGALMLLVVRNEPFFAAGLAALAARVPLVPDWRANVDPARFPIAAADYLARAPHLGRLLNDFDWGGFLIYHLHPRYRVSLDGRTELYRDDVLRDFWRAMTAAPGWERYLARAAPDAVVWPRLTPFAELLAGRPEWRAVYRDAQAVIYVRDRAAAGGAPAPGPGAG
jgi:hypothetical protein